MWLALVQSTARGGIGGQRNPSCSMADGPRVASPVCPSRSPDAPPARRRGKSAFPTLQGCDWHAEEATLGRAMLAWFPEITLASPPPPTAAFLHFFCGLLTLADWVASEHRAFPFEPLFHSDDWSIAQDRAAARIAQIG